MGVIATLTSGFETLNRRLWLLALPMALDLLLWCGPQISVAPIVRHIAALWITSPATQTLAPDQIVPLRQGFEDLAKSINLFDLLALSTPGRDAASRFFTVLLVNILEVPALTIMRDKSTAAAPISMPALEIGEPWLALALSVGLLGLGLFLSTAFLGLMTQIVCEDEIQIGAWLRSLVPNTARLGLYLIVGSALLLVPSALLLSLAMPFSSSDPAALAFLLITPWLWVGLYLFFAPAAMLVNQVNPFRAMWYSFNILRTAPWHALGVILCVTVIKVGSLLLWQQLLVWPWGVVLGMIGNAYVGTGLILAVLRFYRDHYRRWQEWVMAAGPG
ncbi:MAG: hypothetical protein KKA73_21380 [Chloroflexi bacterium]|nr:hypothetical protein [Chloroflexota bacterium]MBU1750246.1 hypothetical protein [Chloroflexota bacterium]